MEAGHNPKKNVLENKSLLFALRIINAYKYITQDKQEYILSKQLLRSGTSVGAMIKEAEFAESKMDFIHKLNVALKEANETRYWLMLLKGAEYISVSAYESIEEDCNELIRLLVSIIKTSRQNLPK
ncbi:MAG: four helix bundle protein [Bacteroidetes bacterium]|uniref:Four helix bundle protein n=1 Tax=Candidatus Enterocola intestinipullorum TaxID=2840783 RepID=A0A9D9HDR6_9BACT|nr:four helix bundle protein [Candidatus Enterocola intestinipullorum]